MVQLCSQSGGGYSHFSVMPGLDPGIQSGIRCAGLPGRGPAMTVHKNKNPGPRFASAKKGTGVHETASAAPIRFNKAVLVGGVLEEGEGSVVELLARCFFPGGHFGSNRAGCSRYGLHPEGNAGE